MTPQGDGLARSLPNDGGPSRLRAALAYGAMLVGAVVVFLVIDARGAKLAAPEPIAAAAERPAPMGP